MSFCNIYWYSIIPPWVVLQSDKLFESSQSFLATTVDNSVQVSGEMFCKATALKFL